jgi:RecB family exonuclease
VPRVWVAGLAQDLFASPSRPDPILGDAVRWKIAELTGLPIRTSMRRAEEADVQFALAEAAGRDALTLSWPRLEDVSGQMRFPADPLARRIEELAGEPPPPDDPSTSKAVTAVPAEPPQPTPGGERGRLLDEHEYDLAACLDANPRLCGHLEDDVALRRCMTTQRERWQERRLTRYDGITGVDERFPERFSPSSLERLARCPFRFLLHDRLGLRPGPEDAAAVAPDLLEIGSLAHDVLQAQFEKLIDCAPGDLPESARMIEGLGPSVDEALEKLVRRGAGGSRSVWRTVASRMRGELALVMLRELDRLKEERLRVESVERTLEGEIVAGGATIPLRGRADRIDRDAEGRLSVTDYKYSKGGRYKRSCVFDGGRTLQLPVYARLLAGERGSAGEVRFVFLRDDAERADSVTDLSETREWDDRLESLVSRLLETARAGAYFQVIEDGCRYCEFTDLCGPRKERLSELKGEAPQKLSHEALRKEFP